MKLLVPAPSRRSPGRWGGQGFRYTNGLRDNASATGLTRARPFLYFVPPGPVRSAQTRGRTGVFHALIHPATCGQQHRNPLS